MSSKTYDFIPHDYQEDMIDWQINVEREGIWAGMGTGKTVTTLTAQNALQMSGQQAKPFLVLAPLRVARSTWPNEVLKWRHLNGMEITPVVGSATERHHKLFKGLAAGNSAGYTTNYENVPWLIETLTEAKKGWPFGTLIADELTRLKNFKTRQGGKRAQALGKIAHTHVNRFVGLTGTPAPNGLKDLWGQTWFIDKGNRLGANHSAFLQRWFYQHPSGFGYIPHSWAETQIHGAVRDIYLSVDHNLPVKEPIRNTVYIDLPDRVRAAYREMERQMFAELDGTEHEAFNAASRTQKCLQIASGAIYLETDGARKWQEVHTEKIQALESIISEANGMPVLVAFHFVSTLERLQKHFPQGRHFDTNPKTEQAWNNGRIPLMFVHPKSGGHGSNLQDGGNILVFFDHDWNLEEYQQVIERIGPVRQLQSGHNRPVFIHYLVARDTIDEVVMERREGKAAVQDLLLDAMKRRAMGKELS